MCEIEGVDVGGSTSIRATSLPPTLLPSPLGPLPTTPSMLTSERKYEPLRLTSSRLISASFPSLPSSLPDLPSRLRLSSRSLPFNFLNGLENDFRRSMSVVGRCRLWRARRVEQLVVLVQGCVERAKAAVGKPSPQFSRSTELTKPLCSYRVSPPPPDDHSPQHTLCKMITPQADPSGQRTVRLSPFNYTP